VISIPPSGFTRTSWNFPEGYGSDHFCFLDAAGKCVEFEEAEHPDSPSGAIRARQWVGTGKRHFFAFFVGSASALRQTPSDPPDFSER
jgi:hypothetical protein